MAKRKPLSEETKRKIGEAAKRRFLDSLKDRDPADEPNEKRCPKCKTWKLVDDFGTRKAKRKSGVVMVVPRPYCKLCDAQRVQEWKEDRIADGTWPEFRKRKEQGRDIKKLRQYQREWQTARRRERGVKGKKKPSPEVGPTLSVGPIAQWLEAILETEPPELVSARTGVNPRRIYALVHGEQASVSLRTIDALLTGFNCPEELNILYPPKPEKLAGYHVLDPEGILDGK